MHPNPVFHSKAHAKDIAFARARGFGTLMMNGADVPLVAQIPFLLDHDGSSADIHLVRSNPIARRTTGPMAAVLVVSGTDSYVSPDWYGVADQVPTWNYVSVQLTGQLVPLPTDEMRAMLDRQSAHFEALLAPKPPWRTDKMTDEVLARMMRMILPFRFDVQQIAATWKLGQNKPDAVRLGAAEALGAANIGVETEQLAEWMRAPPKL